MPVSIKGRHSGKVGVLAGVRVNTGAVARLIRLVE